MPSGFSVASYKRRIGAPEDPVVAGVTHVPRELFAGDLDDERPGGVRGQMQLRPDALPEHRQGGEHAADDERSAPFDDVVAAREAHLAPGGSG
jgi:hypothetical protein